MSKTPYCFGCEGNASFIRAVVDAADSTIDVFFSGSDWEQDSSLPRRVPYLQQDESIRAFGFLEVAGGFTIFVASCFGKKIFDEIYERTLKRPLTPFLDRLFLEGSPACGKAVDIRDVIYLEDIDTVVVIRARVTADQTKEVTPLFLQAHRIAHTYIANHGRQAPVHCHTITDGSINIEPELFLSLEQQSREEKRAALRPPDA
jgi:hypothetical protein